MTPKHDLHRPHLAEEMLEDYALGTLYAEEAAWMEEHLSSCVACQQAIVALKVAVQSLSFAPPQPPVPMSDDLWHRIEQSVSRSDGSAPVPGATEAPPQSNIRPFPPRRLMTRQWLAIAALMVLSLMGGTLLGRTLPRAQEDVLGSQEIAIQFTDPSISASGLLRYIPGEQVFVLEVDGLTPPPEGFVHQGWLIDESGPVPAGLMDTTKGELASVGTPDQYQAFAITLEPGPLGNETPTSEPILVAPLNDANGES